MRFAFYGRVSTEDQQDPEASRSWQISRARQLIEPSGGVVVAEYFDIGMSRSLPWKRRPGVGAAAPGSRPAEPGFRCRRDRRASSSVLRRPVRPHLPRVDPLRRAAVGARGRRPGRPRQRRPRARHGPVRRHEQGRTAADQDPSPVGHGVSGHRWPIPRWPAALRLPAGRCRRPSEPRQGGRRQAATPPRARPVKRTDRASGSTASTSPGSACTPSPSASPPTASRARARRPGAQPAPLRDRVVEGGRPGHPAEPALHRPRGLEPSAAR